MRFSWRHLLPVVLTALWLPVQSLTAFVMPLAFLTAPADVLAQDTAVAPVDTMPCHGHGAAVDSDEEPLTLTQDDCQRCDACHLACASYLPVAQALPSLLCGEHVLSSLAMHTLSSRFLEPLDHPPRLTA